MERAIEFILKSQARAEARLERMEMQQADGERRLNEYANLHATFVQVVTNAFAGQAEINRQQAEVNRRLAENIRGQAENIRGQSENIRQQSENIREVAETVRELGETVREQAKSIREQAAAQSRTDERLNALINVVERHIGEGGHGHAP